MFRWVGPAETRVTRERVEFLVIQDPETRDLTRELVEREIHGGVLRNLVGETRRNLAGESVERGVEVAQTVPSEMQRQRASDQIRREIEILRRLETSRNLAGEIVVLERDRR